MRILYCATDQRVPGTLGGSTHVRAVAEGLARLGHDVHALVGRGDGPFPEGAVHWHAMGAPLGRAQLRVFRAGSVRRLADTIRPDLVMERYHNFGGEGRAGRTCGACAARPRSECAGHRSPGIAQGLAGSRARRPAVSPLARVAAAIRRAWS